jgi:hypothetical protein
MIRRWKVTDLLGWASVLLLLGGFVAVNFEWLTVRQPAYHIINIVGALGIITTSTVKRDYEPVVLNLFYGLIAVIALTRLFFLP